MNGAAVGGRMRKKPLSSKDDVAVGGTRCRCRWRKTSSLPLEEDVAAVAVAGG